MNVDSNFTQETSTIEFAAFYASIFLFTYSCFFCCLMCLFINYLYMANYKNSIF